MTNLKSEPGHTRSVTVGNLLRQRLIKQCGTDNKWAFLSSCYYSSMYYMGILYFSQWKNLLRSVWTTVGHQNAPSKTALHSSIGFIDGDGDFFGFLCINTIKRQTIPAQCV